MTEPEANDKSSTIKSVVLWVCVFVLYKLYTAQSAPIINIEDIESSRMLVN